MAADKQLDISLRCYLCDQSAFSSWYCKTSMELVQRDRQLKLRTFSLNPHMPVSLSVM